MDPLEQGTEKITHPAPATPGGDVVVESDKIEGGVYKGARPSVGPWKCPACGVENNGPLQAGCASCGSGSAQPKHVGVPPAPRPKPGSNAGRIGVGVWENDLKQQRQIKDDIHAVQPLVGFDEWYVERFKDSPAPSLKNILAEAWHAAIVWYVSQKPTVVGTEPPTAEVIDVDNVRVPRALIQKVIEIIEGTLELSEDEIGIVLAQLRETLDE